MSDSTHLHLPYLEASQAQKHVTVNEALARLDALVQLAVISRTLAAPPPTPVEGDRYLVAASPTGLWASHAGKLAVFLEGLWTYVAPQPGWRVWVETENLLLVFDGANWNSTTPDILQNLQMLGVNATADSATKFAVSASASLFNHAGAGHQIKLNKTTAGQTASLLWQTGFSGRAEIGTTGDDNFHFKVSSNGMAWQEALTINRTTGVVSLPQGLSALPVFTTAERGLVPQSVAGSQKYLRCDGAWETPAGSSGTGIPYKTAPNRWHVNSADTTTLTTLAGVANRIDLGPWLCPADLTFDQVGVLCSTAVAGALGKVVCYDSDADGRPANLLFETATLDFATAGFKAVAQVQSLQRGSLYWFGLRHSSTATVNAHQPYCTPVLGFPAVPTTAANKLLRRILAFATAAPDTWGWLATEETAANVPAIFVELV